MSDTQSSQEQQTRVEQKMEAKIRDLLDRAKVITPFYDDDTLLLIYKDCFHTDHVFLNKLEIIAKNHKNAQQQEDQDWIQFKQQQKAAVKVHNNGEHTQNRPKFNFLNDKQLLQRAKHFDLESQRAFWERKKQEFREKPQNRSKNNYQNKSKYQQKEQNQEVAHNEKKMKFKQKVEVPAPSATNTQPPQISQPVPESTPKPAAKFAEKKQKYAEKKTEKSEPTPPNSNHKPQNPSKNESIESKKEVKQHQKPKYQEKAQKVETTANKPQPKVEEKQQKTQIPHVKELPKVVATQPVSQKLIQSPAKKITSQKELDLDVKKEFEKSCQSNTFILKFIQPTSKLQKISYIRDPNGTYREVKTRQPLSK